MKYTFFVSKGSFTSINDAAYGEKNISWTDFSADECRACTECFCAIDAKNVLKEKKNLDVSVFDINDFSENGDVLVFLGEKCSKFAAKKYDLPYNKIDDEESYRLYSTEKNNKNIVLLYGGSRKGTSYAMMDYLERHGIRFVSPDDYGTYYRCELDISSKTEFDISCTPSFKTREAYSEFMYDTSTECFMWCYHNKLNLFFLVNIENAEIMHKLCIGVVGGGHEMWYKYMDPSHEYPYKHKIFGGDGKPDDPYEISPFYKGDTNGDGILTYGEAHPEWYAETDGNHPLRRDYERYKTGYATGDFICTTNEDGTDEFVKLLVKSLTDGEYRHLSKLKLFGLDNGTWCQCEKCREIETYSYKIIMLAHKINKSIKKATAEGKIKRKISIELNAYHETLPPPHKPLPEDFDYSSIFTAFYVIERCYAHNINDPNCIESNKMLHDTLMSWVNGHFKGEFILGEYYNVSTFSAMPFVFTERMKNDIPFYYNHGARHLTYLHMLARCWGMQALNNYLYARLMWNVNADVDNLVNEYLVARYGKHAEKMKDIYKEIENAGANCKFIKHYQFVANENKSYGLWASLILKNKDLFNLKHIQLDTRLDDYQAGPSLMETRDRYEACFNDFAEYAKDINDPALKEDYIQLEYAVNTLNYMYNKAKILLDKGDEETERLVELYKEKLKHTTAPLRGYDFGNKFINGLTTIGIHEQ